MPNVVVKGKPSSWNYNPVNADVRIIQNSRSPSKMEPIKESDSDSKESHSKDSAWEGISYNDPKITTKNNKNNSASQTESPHIDDGQETHL